MWEDYSTPTLSLLTSMRKNIENMRATPGGLGEGFVYPTITSIEKGWELILELSKQSLLARDQGDPTFSLDGSDPYTWLAWGPQGLFVIITDTGEILVETVNIGLYEFSSIKCETISEAVEEIKKSLV